MSSTSKSDKIVEIVMFLFFCVVGLVAGAVYGVHNVRGVQGHVTHTHLVIVGCALIGGLAAAAAFWLMEMVYSDRPMKTRS